MNHLTLQNPPVNLVKVFTGTCEIFVADDSVLAGGTKQRAAVPFLRELQRDGMNRFVYASPFAGFAQKALANACEVVGAECIIFAEKQNGGMSPITASIQDIATIELFDTLADAEHAANQLGSSAFKIPLGFAHPRYKHHLLRVLRQQWRKICRKANPKRLWLPVGSGTLFGAFREVVDVDVDILCVDVGVLPDSDPRIQKVLASSIYMKVPELFAEQARLRPPIKSNLNYDAKLWQMLLARARSGDVWWNVAGE